MDVLLWFWDLVVHLDKHLAALVQQYGPWIYGLLFLIIFCETGLVVTPFLPGDSLLFVAGTLWAASAMDVHLLVVLLILAAVLGDTVNYLIGAYLGPKVFHWEQSRFFNRRALDRTHEFYERHGGKTIIIARFVPLIRTFAPFVAGIGRMTYRQVPDLQRGRRRVVGGVADLRGLLLRQHPGDPQQPHGGDLRNHRDFAVADRDRSGEGEAAQVLVPGRRPALLSSCEGVAPAPAWLPARRSRRACRARSRPWRNSA